MKQKFKFLMPTKRDYALRGGDWIKKNDNFVM